MNKNVKLVLLSLVVVSNVFAEVVVPAIESVGSDVVVQDTPVVPEVVVPAIESVGSDVVVQDTPVGSDVVVPATPVGSDVVVPATPVVSEVVDNVLFAKTKKFVTDLATTVKDSAVNGYDVTKNFTLGSFKKETYVKADGSYDTTAIAKRVAAVTAVTAVVYVIYKLVEARKEAKQEEKESDISSN